MLWTKYEGLSYPTNLSKNRGSVIRYNFLDFLHDEMMFMHYLPQLNQNMY